MDECRYVTPLDAGYSTEFVEESLNDHIYPTGRSVLFTQIDPLFTIYYLHNYPTGRSVLAIFTQIEPI